MPGTHRDALERLVRGGAGSAVVHGALIGLLFVPLPPPRLPTPGTSPRVTLSRVSNQAPTARPSDPPFRAAPDDTTDVRLSLENGPGGADFRIDLRRIRERRNDLFPFVTWELRFLRERPGDRDRGGLAFDPGVGEIPPPGGPPLKLSPDQIQALVDRAWARRDRWANLQELVALAERYHPDRGDLPEVVHQYVTQNVPQPYEDWSDPDPVYWITLMLASDDGPLVEFIGRYARRYPVSRVTTELLFLLDASAESSCEVLLRVLRAGAPELPLTLTQVKNPEAYELASSLAASYRRWIIRHDARLPAICDRARVDALRRIIDTSPEQYGVADARFRMGQLLWRAGRRAEAVDWWSGMQADEREQYAVARKRVLGALADGAAESNPSRLSGILHDEEVRWQIAARERLEYFGTSATEF